MEELLKQTGSLEQFRLAVVAGDETLLKQFKELISVQMESEKKGIEFQLRDMDMAEAKRLFELNAKEEKKKKFAPDSSL